MQTLNQRNGLRLVPKVSKDWGRDTTLDALRQLRPCEPHVEPDAPKVVLGDWCLAVLMWALGLFIVVQTVLQAL